MSQPYPSGACLTTQIRIFSMEKLFQQSWLQTGHQRGPRQGAAGCGSERHGQGAGHGTQAPPGVQGPSPASSYS